MSKTKAKPETNGKPDAPDLGKLALAVANSADELDSAIKQAEHWQRAVQQIGQRHQNLLNAYRAAKQGEAV